MFLKQVLSISGSNTDMEENPVRGRKTMCVGVWEDVQMVHLDFGFGINRAGPELDPFGAAQEGRGPG